MMRSFPMGVCVCACVCVCAYLHKGNFCTIIGKKKNRLFVYLFRVGIFLCSKASSISAIKTELHGSFSSHLKGHGTIV
ncbi:MAG: hypothetical protein BYD32DRAFT_405734 [Podila humilis]|nr:MAG: hypothetical protein BYD32DRAFT_405734 [Podila humilis]